MSAISESEWRWDGHAGHLIVAKWCRFHLSTRVGDYRISTIGEYVQPNIAGIEPDGKDLGGPEYAEFESVGLGRLFETYVFRVHGDGLGEVDDWGEIDSLSANDHDTANANHLAMCRKYAKRAGRSRKAAA